MRTKHASVIIYAPELLPEQRIYEVIDLKPCPEGMETFIEWNQPLTDNPPRRGPINRTFLCNVEWSWSPINHRIDNYYLGRRNGRWTLWNNWINDWYIPWEWNWDFLAYTNQIEAEPHSVAIHLLLDYWLFATDELGLDQCHWISREGMVDVKTIRAIQRGVWS